MIRLIVEIRFAHKLPDDLRTELEADEGASHFEQHASTLAFEVFDSPTIQERLCRWMEETCRQEGDVQAVKVTRIGP